MATNNGEEAVATLFETKVAKGRALYKLFSSTILVGIILIWIYRLVHIPRTGEPGRYAWFGMFFSEFLFGLYWIITQSGRWNVVYRTPFKEKLSASYADKMPGVDIFVCTADPVLEPPSLVINTVLSLISYSYPPEKLSVYVSDDGGSELTFYALLEVSKFSKYWIPFCKKYNVEPRAPEVFFSQKIDTNESNLKQEWTSIKELYVDMKSRIDSAAERGSIPKEIKNQHKGFSEWDNKVTKQDHPSIVQILIDGWNPNSVDVEGNRLPTLVYMSREKNLIRVSSEISNGSIILNLDCDMYANDPDALHDALWFFLDEKQGKSICYVQHPQRYSNITKNDIYANIAYATNNVYGFGGALYIGTGCFHRRESLSGKKYSEDHRIGQNTANSNGRTVEELEEASKVLANCSYEKGTLWGKEMGLVYGCPVEDIVTGLTIQCKGWKPVYYNPSKSAFLGVAPITLDLALVQHKRWAEGMFQIFFSKYCPFVYGRGRISLGAQMGYCIYLLWAPVSLPTLCYVIIPALCLLHEVSLFPEVWSFWFAPFAYVSVAYTTYNLFEDLICGDTLKGWWNYQRMWLIRRTTSYFFAFFDTISRHLGLSETSFVVTAKVVNNDLQKRYEQEIMEFGSSSIMFLIISTLALLNLLGFGWGIKSVVLDSGMLEKFVSQIAICGLLAAMNVPVYEALFLRSDEGKIPSSVLFKSIVVASVACLIPAF
ncbi:hypothetical protein F511_00348 [Dorcoceras hygrometricum]|nr:hypothetical protein F511_00348 [Dorcoceras hygrometricum]